MNIRRAVYADCEELAALDAVCNPSAWTQRQFESALDAGRRKNYYRTADGKTEDAVLMEKIC